MGTLDVGGDGGAEQTPITQDIDYEGNNILDLGNVEKRTSVTGLDIDFDETEMQTISITTDTLFTTTNRAIGRSKVIKIATDSTLRQLTFPEWDWISDTIPSSQEPSSNGYVKLTCWGSTDADIEAEYFQALIPDVSQDYIDAIEDFSPALGSPAQFHDENPATGASVVAGGVKDWRLDLQSKKIRPLKANPNASRSPFVTLTWSLEYSDDNTNWTVADTAVQTVNGGVVLDGGSPSFRYCRISIPSTVLYNFVSVKVGTTNA